MLRRLSRPEETHEHDGDGLDPVPGLEDAPVRMANRPSVLIARLRTWAGAD